MSKYEFLMCLADKCHQLALDAGCDNLRKFYLNAEQGFIIKGRKLTVEEASK